jgi:polysaccharide pyruvyl transferase WcaK-like protein
MGSGDLVAVVVRPSRVLGKIAGDIARVVDVLASRCGAQVIFVPFQRPVDVEAAVSIIRRCRTAPVLMGGGYNLATMTALFKRCTAVVGMRLHSLILAARLGVPFLAVPYDPKIVALSESLRYPLAPLQHGMADELTESLWTQRTMLSAHVRDAANSQAAAASQAFDWLQEVVEGAVS